MCKSWLCGAAICCLLAGGSRAANEPAADVQTLKPGVEVTLVAEHPDLATPTGIDVDAEGRIWVVATHTHFRPEDYVGPEHDEILIFSDEDGDGRAETRDIFYNATVATMDLELGADGWVYLAERDRILRIRDTDGDGQADLEEDLAVLQTEANYPHNGLEGLAWHPDGSLIFSLGENFAKPWTLTAVDGTSDRGTGEGGVFRCTPDGKHLHRIARGFWNPFGICVREDGEMFAAENDPGARPPCRLLHVVEGGDYGYQRLYGSEAHHPFVCWNGELPGTLPMIHPTGEAPCGVQPLGGGVLATTWTDHRIDFYPLVRRGASFVSTRVVLAQGGNHFRPTCLTQFGDLRGTGDALADSDRDDTATFYFTDWVLVNYQSHGKGRIWRLDIDLTAADWLQPKIPEPPDEATRLARGLRHGEHDLSSEELRRLTSDRDPFLARAALVALARQAAEWEPDEVKAWPIDDRVAAVQALRIAALEQGSTIDPAPFVTALIDDEESEVVYQTLRWIADGGMTEFLPQIERLQGRADLEFRLFEAMLATRNRLAGKPAAGVRDEELLLSTVQNPQASPRIRAYALKLLPTIPRVAKEGDPPRLVFPKGLTIDTLRGLVDAGNESLAREAIRTLAGNPIPASVAGAGGGR